MPIININQLNQLMNSTMVYAVVVGLAAFVVALIVANMFPWEGGNDRSYIKRRIAFVVIGVCAVLGFWIYNDQVVADSIKNQGFLQMFKSCNLKCLVITSVIYLLISGILMCVFRNSKFASIIFKIKGK